MAIPIPRPKRVISRTACRDSRQYRDALGFRLMDLNCLAPSLVDQRYKDHDANIMNSDFREKEVLAEILTKNPDVLTLQEVEQPQYERYLQALGGADYSGRYQRHSGSRSDGVATLWKETVYELIGEKEISFHPAQAGDANLRAQMTSLRLRETDVSGQRPIIIIVNCHLVFDFSKSGLKVAQMTRLISELHLQRVKLASPPTCTFVQELEGGAKLNVDVFDPRSSRLPAAILVGDFNFTPFSPMYSYIATGSPHPEFAKAADNDEQKRLLSGQALMFGRASNMATWRTPQREAVQAALQATPMFCRRGVERGCYARTEFDPPTTDERRRIQDWLLDICPHLNLDPFQRTVVLSFEQPPEAPLPTGWENLLREKLQTANLTSETLVMSMSSGTVFHSPIHLISTMRLPSGQVQYPDSQTAATPPPTVRTPAPPPQKGERSLEDSSFASEPWATVYQGNQRGTVDYVWVDDSQIQVIRHFALPTESHFKRCGPIPNDHWPLSDHFSLCADLQLLEGSRLSGTMILSLLEEGPKIDNDSVEIFLAEQSRRRYFEGIGRQCRAMSNK